MTTKSLEHIKHMSSYNHNYYKINDDSGIVIYENHADDSEYAQIGIGELDENGDYKILVGYLCHAILVYDDTRDLDELSLSEIKNLLSMLKCGKNETIFTSELIKRI